MSFISNNPIVNSLSNTIPLINLRKVERTFREGQNHLYVGLIQFSQVSLAFEALSSAFSKVDTFSRFTFRWGVCCVPLMLAYKAFKDAAAHSELDKMKPLERRVTYILIDHITNTSTLITMVSSVALIVFGHYTQGVCSLSLLTGEYLVENGHVSLRVQQFFYKCVESMNTISLLFSQNIFPRLLGITSLGFDIYHRFKKDVDIPVGDQVRLQDYRVYDVPEGLSEYPPRKQASSLKLSLDHLKQEILPLRIPNVSYDDFTVLLDSVEWTPTFTGLLMAKLREDQRWSQRVNAGGEEDAKIYFKECFAEFLTRVRNKAILAGQPMSYDAFEVYLKHILVMLKELNQSDPQQVALILLQLGIEGVYCGPGVFRLVEENFLSLLSHHGELNFKQRIYLTLQLFRLRIFQKTYNEVTKLLSDKSKLSDCHKVLGKEGQLPENAGKVDYYNWTLAKLKKGALNVRAGLFDRDDVHLYNLVLHIVGKSFGLPTLSADNDQTIERDALNREMYSRLEKAILAPLLLEYKTQLIDEVYESWGSPLLPSQEGEKEIMEWVSKRDASFSEEEKQEKYLLQMDKLYTTIVEGGRYKVKLNKKMLAFYLADIGVYQ